MAEISMGSALAELESSLGAEADEASIGAVSVVLLDFSDNLWIHVILLQKRYEL